MSPVAFLACVVIGFIAGVINVLAAGGSFLTLPLLLFLGCRHRSPTAPIASGIVTQNIAAAWGFHQHRVLNWRWALAVSTPALSGAGDRSVGRTESPGHRVSSHPVDRHAGDDPLDALPALDLCREAVSRPAVPGTGRWSWAFSSSGSTAASFRRASVS